MSKKNVHSFSAWGLDREIETRRTRLPKPQHKEVSGATALEADKAVPVFAGIEPFLADKQAGERRGLAALKHKHIF